MAESIKVVCRFRGGQDSEQDRWNFDPNGVTVRSPEQGVKSAKTFTFDSVLDANSTQEKAYLEAGRGSVQALLNGFNGTIFAYGQSGSGKTFTMLGPDSVVDAIKNGADGISVEVQRMYGVIPRAIGDIFEAITRLVSSENAHIELSVQYLEIYNEKVQDLLTKGIGTQTQDLKLRELPNGQMFVSGSEHKVVQSFDDIFMALMYGQRSRAVASTNQNDRSSRSHTIFVISYKQQNTDGSQKSGRLNLVDLAGSERIAKTGATGQTLAEAQKINLSLTKLGLVIKALTEGAKHVPFRDSKLTLLLKDALGGNSKTTLICTASKQLRHLDEAVQTLQFAERAKRIKNKANRNVIRSPKEMSMLIEKLQTEVAALKHQLMQNGLTPLSKLLPDNSLLAAKPEVQSKTTTSLSVTQDSATCGLPHKSEEEESKGEVSFNTLLDDSTLTFDPDADARILDSPIGASEASLSPSPLSKKPTKKEMSQMKVLMAQIDDYQIKLQDLENEYEVYKTRTQTEMIELRDKSDTMQNTLDTMPNVENILNDLRETQYTAANKEEEAERVTEDCKKKLIVVQEEIADLKGKLGLKDDYIRDLEEQNEELHRQQEKIGYETFTQVKNDLFSRDQTSESLAQRKQYMPIYEQFERETTDLMVGYTQQETAVQELQAQNAIITEQLRQASSEVADLPERVPDNSRLASLTNRIMELVLDNIRLLHVNSKVIDYCKRQSAQQEFTMNSMQTKMEHTNTHVEQSSEELSQMQADLEELRSKNASMSELLENERSQYQKTIREKEYNLRKKVNDLNTQLRAEKVNIVRIETEKAQVQRYLDDIKEDLAKVKGSEKKLKSELQDEKLKHSSALQEALMKTQQQQQMSAAMQGGPDAQLGYQGYLSRQRATVPTQMNLKNKFFDYSQMSQPVQQQFGSQNSMSNRGSSRLGALPATMARPQRQTNRFSTSVDQMLSMAGLRAEDESVTKELTEDIKQQDLGAEAMDELDAMIAEEDLASSEGSENDD